MNKGLDQLFWNTEKSLFGSLKAKCDQTALWCDLCESEIVVTGKTKLIEVSTQEHWDTLYNLRQEIEKPFGIFDKSTIKSFIDEIKVLCQKPNVSWFLAVNDGQYVGSIGLVVFSLEDQECYGRLLDVDIAPEFQKRGYGNDLLALIKGEAQKKGCAGLCLKTDSDGWVKSWYLRNGFKVVGEYPAGMS